MDYIEEGRKVLIQEAEGLKVVADKLDDNFKKAVKLLFNCRGRVIITGMGKSGIISRKIAATLTSVGVPATFLHPSEAAHGDLGIVTRGDVVIFVSKSGETDEIKTILPNLRLLGVPTIGITSNPKSTLGEKCDVKLLIDIPREADPNDMVPTTSTSAALAMGDALAVVLMKLKQLGPEDIAMLHPGGALGKKLTITVGDLMHKPGEFSKVLGSATIKDTLLEFTRTGLGVAAIVDENAKLLGVFTDGDLRRLLEKEQDCLNLKILSVMRTNPKTISKDELAFTALKKMEQFRVTALIVTDESNIAIGVINLHEILKAGIA